MLDGCQAYRLLSPGMRRKKITLPTDLVADWTKAAAALGYGERGRNQLLRRMIEVAVQVPAFFTKR